MKSFKLRPGGASVVMIYVYIFALLAIGLLGNLSDWYWYGLFNWTAFSLSFGLPIFLCILFTLDFFKARIEIDKSRLLVSRVAKFEKGIVPSPDDQAILEGYHVGDIRLADIQGVQFCELYRLQEQLAVLNSPQASGFFDYFHNATASFGRTQSSSWIRMPVWFASKHMPVMFVQAKNASDSFVVTVKPFSKKGLQRLMSALRSNGVAVSAQPSLHLGK